MVVGGAGVDTGIDVGEGVGVGEAAGVGTGVGEAVGAGRGARRRRGDRRRRWRCRRRGRRGRTGRGFRTLRRHRSGRQVLCHRRAIDDEVRGVVVGVCDVPTRAAGPPLDGASRSGRIGRRTLDERARRIAPRDGIDRLATDRPERPSRHRSPRTRPSTRHRPTHRRSPVEFAISRRVQAEERRRRPRGLARHGAARAGHVGDLEPRKVERADDSVRQLDILVGRRAPPVTTSAISSPVDGGQRDRGLRRPSAAAPRRCAASAVVPTRG